MKKLPVLATIRDAYRFTFTHLGAIIGLIWLPMILVTVIGFFVLQRYYQAFADALTSNNYAGMGPEVLMLLGYLVGALLLTTMMSVPVTQLALGTRKEGALVYFAFTATEWRLFRGILGLVGFMMVPLLLIGVAAGVLESSGGGPLGAARGALTIQGLAAVFYLACLYFGLRFGVLLPALAASETEPLLPRAWKLTAGNFWRIAAVMLATAGPMLILSAVIQTVIAQLQGGPHMLMPAMGSAPAMAAAQFRAMAQQMPLTSGVSFLIAPLMLGLTLGAGAAIYRALNGEKLP